MMIKSRLGNCRGSGMVISLITVTVLSLLAVSLYSITRSQIRESIYEMRLAQAQAIAEAGLDDALHSIYQNPSWKTGFSKKAFAGGTYTVTVSTGASPWVKSTGYSTSIFSFGPAVKTVAAQVRIRSTPADSGCAVQSGSQASIGGVINAYDSASDINALLAGFGANVCANGTIQTVGGLGVLINGNASYYAGTAPLAGAVAGTITKAAATTALPVQNGAAYATSNNNAAVPSAFYNSLTRDVVVPLGQTLTLGSGVYYFNNLQVNGTLIADTTLGAVTIITTGNVNNAASLVTGSIVNTTKAPSLLSIYGQGASNIYLKSTATLYADVQSPAGNVVVSQVLFGRVIADAVNLNVGAILNFDKQLAGQGSPQRVDWRPGTWTESFARQ